MAAASGCDGTPHLVSPLLRTYGCLNAVALERRDLRCFAPAYIPVAIQEPCLHPRLRTGELSGTLVRRGSPLAVKIGIGGAVTRSPLPHHRTYGARIRRFRDLSPQGPEVRYAGSPLEASPLPGCFRASPYPPLVSSAVADWLAHGHPREPRTTIHDHGSGLHPNVSGLICPRLTSAAGSG